jgi:hypothetical protein
MIGILVHGDNHFVVRGPFPDRAAAMALARHWSVIEIGRKRRRSAGKCAGRAGRLPAVTVLLQELAGRGVRIYAASREQW